MKTNGQLIPGVDCAILDSESNDRREVWSRGVLAVWVAREFCTYEQGTIKQMIATGRLPQGCAEAWVTDRVTGDVGHIPLPYRPMKGDA